MNSSDWQTSCSTIQDANLHLLKSKQFSDVVFLVGESKIQSHAHKLILMSRSSVFQVMFERWETETNSQIEIPEITHKSFQLFLEYLYTNTFSVTEEHAVEVLYLAQKYCSNNLAKLCSDLLKSAIHIGNVIQIHQVASRLNEVDLRTQSMDFILRNGKSVFQSAGFLEIDSDILTAILKEDNLAVDELTVFRAVMRWAENRCKMEKLSNTVENKRTLLKNLIHLIRFPLMRTEEFTNEVVRKHKGILTDTETIGIYMEFTTVSSNKPNSTTIPFSRNKRRCSGMYSVELYNKIGTGCFENSSCRQSYTYFTGPTQCVSTLIFSSSANIYMNGIELHGFQNSRQAGCRIKSEFVANSEFIVSVRPIKYPGSSSAKVTSEQLKTLLTPSSIKIEFESEISISKNDQYELKVTFIGGCDRSGCANAMFGGQLTKSAKVICGSVSTTFNFVSGTTQCALKKILGDNGYTPFPCFTSGQIKTIYFSV